MYKRQVFEFPIDSEYEIYILTKLLFKAINEKLVEEYLPEVIFLPKKQFEERLSLKGYRYLETGMQDYICCKRLITGPQTYPELALLLTTSGSTGRCRF